MVYNEFYYGRIMFWLKKEGWINNKCFLFVFGVGFCELVMFLGKVWEVF